MVNFKKDKKRWSRRDFLQTSLAAGIISTGAYFATKSFNPLFTTNILQITDIEISLPEQDAALHNFSLAFLTDIHYSPAIPRNWLTTVLHEVTKREIELLLLGGDYIWIPESPLSKNFIKHRNPSLSQYHGVELAEFEYLHLAEELKKISLQTTILGVLGNHDRWTDVKLCKAAFSNANATLLINDLYTYNTKNGASIEIYGADDYWTGTPNLPSFTKKSNTLPILLSHNPDHVVEQCAGKLPDNALSLSGHTHGGQLCLPLFGPFLYNIRSTEYGYGLKPLANALHFTSQGFGVVELPWRMLCPQELVIIRFISSPIGSPSQKIDQSFITV